MKSLSNKHWRLRSPAPPAQFERFPHLPPFLVQLLYNRGVTEPEDVAAFLRGEVTFHNPFRLQGMHRAVDRIRHAIRRREAIIVYGDFDADGVTASALLVLTLRALGANARAYIPHRVDEGYGLNGRAIRKLATAGARLLITVDCGIRSVQEVQLAQSLGMDVIVSDHHSIGPELPPALAVINPKRADDRYPFKELAGVGVAFKIAQALLRVERNVPVRRGYAVTLQEHDLLDLVALGTVADIVPLLAENRVLVARGMQRLNDPQRPGIAALMQAAGIRPGNVDTMTIGFMLAPRLNAAGRIAHARLGYNLLTTQDMGEALSLAHQLNNLNRTRQQLTEQAVERAQAQLAAQQDRPVYIVQDPEFLPGIVGLVAGQITNATYRPTLAIHLGPDTSRGSARSIPEFNITAALDACSDLLVRYGGHAAAAGLTLKTQNIPLLHNRLHRLALEWLGDVQLEPVMDVDMELDLVEVDWGLYEHLQRLAPFGEGNPRPLFLSRGLRVLDARAVGNEGKHLRLTLRNEQRTWPAIAFKQGHLLGALSSRVDVVYYLDVNEWHEERTLQLVVQDIRPSP